MLQLWLLTVLYGVVGGANIARGLLALTIASVFADQSLALPLLFLGVVYVIWGVGFIVVLALCWRRPRLSARARKIALGVAPAYQATIWAIRLFGVRATQARRLWGRNLLLSAIFFSFVFVLTLKEPDL